MQEDISPIEETSNKEEEKEEGATPQKFIDTNFLPFPHHHRKPKVDEQFTRFVEVMQKVHINMTLIYAMQVLYARYLKDILNN